jgi:hypothetical protein
MALSLYYFDVRNNDRLFSARTEAFSALVDYAREVTPTVIRRHLAVEVRDENSTS